MYNIIDSSYGQNLGFEEFPSEMETVTRVLQGESQLTQWLMDLMSSSSIHVYTEIFKHEQLEKMDESNLIFQRFNLVLSLRYHNLRILLHRQFLEMLLDSYGGRRNVNPSMSTLKQIQITSVQKCVESAMVVISIVRCITSSAGWRRDLLGAWNFSLYYSMFHIFVCSAW